MNNYSLKQFLLENEEQVSNNSRRTNSVSRLIGGMQKTKLLNESTDQPIVPRGTDWEHLTSPNRLRRVFEIESQMSRRLFINDALNLADQSLHHIELNIVAAYVSVEIYTEELNDVTDMDFEYAKDIDEMYIDTLFSHSNKTPGDTDELW